MRQARSATTLLLRVQAERRKMEADGAALDKAARTGYCAIGLMADALPGAPRAAAEMEPPASPLSAPDPVLEMEPEADPMAEADQYAIIYPQRAKQIRALGRLPDGLDFGPPSPELVHAIVTGANPILRALDDQLHTAVS
jgi:hypothetical protein